MNWIPRERLSSLVGGGSRQFESIEGRGRCSGGQTEMGEDLGNHGGMFDGGDDLQGATARGALLDVDLKHSLRKPSLAFALLPGARRSKPLPAVL